MLPLHTLEPATHVKVLLSQLWRVWEVNMNYILALKAFGSFKIPLALERYGQYQPEVTQVHSPAISPVSTLPWFRAASSIFFTCRKLPDLKAIWKRSATASEGSPLLVRSPWVFKHMVIHQAFQLHKNVSILSAEALLSNKSNQNFLKSLNPNLQQTSSRLLSAQFLNANLCVSSPLPRSNAPTFEAKSSGRGISPSRINAVHVASTRRFVGFFLGVSTTGWGQKMRGM